MTAVLPQAPKKPTVAVIGSGISGLTAAYRLRDCAEVTMFEAADRLGGHTATIDVTHAGQSWSIDTGFIVFNDWTYPRFKQLLAELKVDYQASSMGFSVSCERSGLEYSGDNLGTLFAQKRRLMEFQYWRFLLDITRFNQRALTALAAGQLDDEQTLATFLQEEGFNGRFASHYLVPMASAIWSKSSADSLQMPARFFVEFFKNHGLLSVRDRPTWHVIKGGSKQYIEPLTRSFQQRICLNSRVTRLTRLAQGVELEVNGQCQQFDEVILACHSDQALALLGDANHLEQQILSAIEYQENDVVLHFDDSLLPQRKKCWSSWNYRIVKQGDNDFWQDRAVLTYNMNILQGLQSDTTFCVTLNHTAAIDQSKILGQFQYAHPKFTREAVRAQQRWAEINGTRHTWFCGAWWGNGFHEDGVVSAERVVNALIQQYQPHTLGVGSE